MATPVFNKISCTIPNGAAGLSAAVCLGSGALYAIVMPAVWVAAALTFQGSPDGVAYTNLYDDQGNEISLTVAASRQVSVDPALFGGCGYIKVRSGTAAVPVNQTADRALTLISRKQVIG